MARGAYRVARLTAKSATGRYDDSMSPTLLQKDGFRFYFFSREEARAHVHVQRAEGEAKFWLSPKVGLALNKGLKARQIAKALLLVEENQDAFRKAWSTHFSG